MDHPEHGAGVPPRVGAFPRRRAGRGAGRRPVGRYGRLLHHADPPVRAAAAREWCAWEDAHVSLAPGAEPRLSVADPGFQLAFARIVTHYWANGCFLSDRQLLRGADRLAGIPGVLVHGRYDVSSPLDTAWALHRAWPDSELVVIGDAGDSRSGMTEAIVAATDRFARTSQGHAVSPGGTF